MDEQTGHHQEEERRLRRAGAIAKSYTLGGASIVNTHVVSGIPINKLDEVDQADREELGKLVQATSALKESLIKVIEAKQANYQLGVPEWLPLVECVGGRYESFSVVIFRVPTGLPNGLFTHSSYIRRKVKFPGVYQGTTQGYESYEQISRIFFDYVDDELQITLFGARVEDIEPGEFEVAIIPTNLPHEL